MHDATRGATTPERPAVLRWEICSRLHGTVVVWAPNWIAALGLGLAEAGLDGGLERVACEKLPNGTIIINDISRGERFTVSPLPPEPPPVEEIPPGSPYLDWMLESHERRRQYSQDPLISIH